jgi:hypothetical protein
MEATCRESRLTGHVQDSSALVRLTRRGVLKGLLLSLSAAAAPSVVRADLFGGDIGVLLAQLEQQFQTVSHAIQTVKNLVETVNRLGNIVQNSKTLLEHAKNGGVMGVIDAAQGFVNIGQGVIGRLRLTNNDANWWISKITPLVADKDYQMSSADRAALDSQLAENDRERVKGAKKINAWYDRLKEEYKSLQDSSEAARSAMNTNGMVGQMQIASQQNVLAQKTMLRGVEMQTEMAASQEEEFTRQAAVREATRKKKETAKAGLGTVNESQPVEFDFQLGSGWGGGNSETGLGNP